MISTVLYIGFEGYETYEYFTNPTEDETFGEWPTDDVVMAVADILYSVLILIKCIMKLCCQKQRGKRRASTYATTINESSFKKQTISITTKLEKSAVSRQKIEDERDDMAGKASNIIILGVILIVLSQTLFIIGCFQKNTFIAYLYNVIKLLHGFITPIILSMGFEFNQKCYECCCFCLDRWIRDEIIDEMKRKDSKCEITSMSRKTHDNDYRKFTENS